MMQQRRRLGPVLTVAAAMFVLPWVQACYEYVPLTTETPKVGETVTFEITDQGRVGLSDRFGPGLAEIEGKVVSAQTNEYVINIFRVSQIGGESTLWSGETARLQRSFLGTAKGRQFSRSRTATIAVAGVAIAAYLISSGRLGGGFSGSTEEPPTVKPQSTRIPAAQRP